LIGAGLTAAQQAMSNFTSITAGALDITIDSTPKTLTGLNFSAQTNLNGVAAVIGAALTGATIVWDANYERFEVTSGTTGTTSLVSFVGNALDRTLGLESSSVGAYVANGLAAETALSAVELFDSMFGQTWYSVVVPAAVDADHVAIAGFIEGGANRHFYGVTTQETTVFDSTDTTNIAYQLKQLDYTHTAVQYSSFSVYAVVSLLSRIQTTDYSGNSTTINLMWKQEPGIIPEYLNSNQIAALEGFNCNVFAEYNNNTAIIERGTVADGNYIDAVMGVDAFVVDVMTALFNALYTSTTKIPQTDSGMAVLGTTITTVAAQYVTNGLFGPGTWTSGTTFGNLYTGQFLDAGYYLYTPSVASQSSASRTARVSVPFQFAGKLAGAVNTVNLAITINS
jgi:hypothetical protein